MQGSLQTRLVSVGELLQNKSLQIPLYQRPYKWSLRNVMQLMDDIVHHQDRSSYRLGTIVLHRDRGRSNIVDGQQRIVTLFLILQAVLKHRSSLQNPELASELNKLRGEPLGLSFRSEISIANLRTNYREIERRISSIEESAILFLLKKCEVLQFVLSDISEAFQFFDSQNARGRALEPHDLLKAFHLREFAKEAESTRLEAVQTWESLETNELAGLFAEFLFRVRAWSQGKSGSHFGKDDVRIFKGISLERMDAPFTQLLRIAHFYLEDYNESYHRKIDGQQAHFPFQLTQPILNGRRFFEMVSYYHAMRVEYHKNVTEDWSQRPETRPLFVALSTYEGRRRVGDQYVRNLFDCAVLMYLDKFGEAALPQALEKIFVWAYTLRLRSIAVRLASVDNYVLHESNLFQRIQHAVTPQDVLLLKVPSVQKVRSTKTHAIEQLFVSMGYHETKR